ncbi:anti-sigma factor antagonist [Speluncibacter jeojiensis]|uniref:Anti-sigma factor antagonist n=1 Tax=Speluncibacter jeojiensis TaxID=2710754 RepID=A0A9X4M3N5_9ACTN|nr:anti-sigma factor antagonist [Corynebacteriales bacterium D3-21]
MDAPDAGHDSDLTLTVEAADGCVILHAAGEIDVVTAPRLQDGLEQLIGRHPGSVMIVDLTEVGFLASAGLAVLMRSSELDERSRFMVVASGPATVRPLELTGLSDALDVHATVEAAMATV